MIVSNAGLEPAVIVEKVREGKGGHRLQRAYR